MLLLREEKAKNISRHAAMTGVTVSARLIASKGGINEIRVKNALLLEIRSFMTVRRFSQCGRPLKGPHGSA